MSTQKQYAHFTMTVSSTTATSKRIITTQLFHSLDELYIGLSKKLIQGTMNWSKTQAQDTATIVDCVRQEIDRSGTYFNISFVPDEDVVKEKILFNTLKKQRDLYIIESHL